jgi:hypothetical protein
MGRNLFRGAPELSRLFVEAPIELLTEFLSPRQFPEFLAEAMSSLPVDEGECRQALKSHLKKLRYDRAALIEVEARRVMAMTDETPEVLLRRLGEDLRFGAAAGLRSQRDPIARSLWAYLMAKPLFEAAERGMQVRVYRDHGKLYEAWSIEMPIPLTAQAVDEEALAQEIAARLQHEDGCKVEAVDLPSDDGDSREVLVAVTFFGAYSGQRTVHPDKTIGIFYFRPPDELLLVYSPTRRRIEICSRDPTERRLVARIFAEDTLKHDVSNKPLTQKTYNLARFRRSLRLPIPEHEAHRVRRASITEVQVALGDWSRKVSLSVAPEDDIDAIARSVFGAIIPRSGGGFVTKVRFHIDHVDGRGRNSTLKFDVLGRNKSDIQRERDPAKRALGYDLLETWGVLQRVGDFTRSERKERLPELLALYDLTEAKISGHVLDDLGVDPSEFIGAGFLARTGWSDVILFEDEELGPVVHDVKRDRLGGQVTLSLTEGGSGPQMPAEDVAQFEIRFDYVRDALRELLKPLGLNGMVREVDAYLHQLGTVQIGSAAAPVYLARGLSDDKLLERADRHIRGESNRARGIVFVPRETRFPHLGCHVVLSLQDHIDRTTGTLDARAVRVAHEACTDPASRGAAVHFRKQGNDAAQITVPGQDARIITGPKKVLLFERLYVAHCDREPGVKLAVLKDYAGFSQLPQLFRVEWPELNNRYLYSPRHGYWALCAEPISV